MKKLEELLDAFEIENMNQTQEDVEEFLRDELVAHLTTVDAVHFSFFVHASLGIYLAFEKDGEVYEISRTPRVGSPFSEEDMKKGSEIHSRISRIQSAGPFIKTWEDVDWLSRISFNVEIERCKCRIPCNK